MDKIKLEDKLSELLRSEVERTRENNLERVTDCDYNDGLTPLDDLYAKQLGAGMSRFDIPRHNQMRRNVDWATGYVMQQELTPSVVPIVPADDQMGLRQLAEFRRFQIRSSWDTHKYHRELERIIRDSAVSGEGIGRLKVMRTGRGTLATKLEWRNWRGVWYDTNAESEGIDECDYLFDLKWVPVETVANYFGKDKNLIESIAKPQSLDRNRYELLTQQYDTTYDHDAGYGNREVVLHGQAWWKEYEKGERIVKYAPIVVDRGLNRLYLLDTPHQPYHHNEIPYIRITADRYSKTNLPYSPMTRLRRGYERFMQYPLRYMIALAQGRSGIMSTRAIPKGKNNEPLFQPEEFLAKTSEHLRSPSSLLIVDDLKEIMLDNNSDQMRNMIELMKTLQASSESTGMAIDPSLLGQSTNIAAAVAIQEKARQAHLSFNRLMGNYRNAVERVGMLLLSNVEQFEEFMLFPSFQNEDGADNFMPPVPNILERNKLFFNIKARDRRTGFEGEMMKFMTEFIKVSPPQLQPYILLEISKLSPMGNTGEIRNIAEEMAKLGMTVPEGMLSPQTIQQLEQKSQQDGAKAQQLDKLQKDGIMAEIENKNADTQLKLAKAQMEKGGGLVESINSL